MTTVPVRPGPPSTTTVPQPMPELCDRCSARALTEWTRPGTGRLYTCGHHTTVHQRSMIDKGWLPVPCRPALPPVSADPRTH